MDLLEILSFALTWISTLFALQLVWQLLIASVKHYYLRKLTPNPSKTQNSDGDDSTPAFDASSVDLSEGSGERTALGIPYIRSMGQILGLTGDNSPKKRIIAHDLWKSFSFVFLANLIALEWFRDTVELSFLPWRAASLALAVVLTTGLKLSNIFLLFKIYSEAGFGFNLYFRGFRVIGLDYHSWQIRQDPVTGKPLSREKQFWSRARPHLDIPMWNLHHWPFDQFDDAATLESLMSEKSAQRAEKQARKDEKRKRREEKLRQKATSGDLGLKQRETLVTAAAAEPVQLDPEEDGADTAGLFQ